jgi:antitoxin (DNA-binding transcriptional repressor) of toxin-antitoxin stability system
MCHVNVSHMKKTTVRELKHATKTVLSWVEEGETVEVRRRNRPIAILSPPNRRNRIERPDFEARLRAIYGTKVLKKTGTDVIAESRGES